MKRLNINCTVRMSRLSLHVFVYVCTEVIKFAVCYGPYFPGVMLSVGFLGPCANP